MDLVWLPTIYNKSITTMKTLRGQITFLPVSQLQKQIQKSKTKKETNEKTNKTTTTTNQQT